MWAPILRRHWSWTDAAFVPAPPASADVGLVSRATLGGRLRQVRPLMRTRKRRDS